MVHHFSGAVGDPLLPRIRPFGVEGHVNELSVLRKPRKSTARKQGIWCHQPPTKSPPNNHPNHHPTSHPSVVSHRPAGGRRRAKREALPPFRLVGGQKGQLVLLEVGKVLPRLRRGTRAQALTGGEVSSQDGRGQTSFFGWTMKVESLATWNQPEPGQSRKKRRKRSWLTLFDGCLFQTLDHLSGDDDACFEGGSSHAPEEQTSQWRTVSVFTQKDRERWLKWPPFHFGAVCPMAQALSFLDLTWKDRLDSKTSSSRSRNQAAPSKIPLQPVQLSTKPPPSSMPNVLRVQWQGFISPFFPGFLARTNHSTAPRFSNGWRKRTMAQPIPSP